MLLCFVGFRYVYPLAMELVQTVVLMQCSMWLSLGRAHNRTVAMLVGLLDFNCRLFPTRLSTMISQIVMPERGDRIIFAKDKRYVSRDHRCSGHKMKG